MKMPFGVLLSFAGFLVCMTGCDQKKTMLSNRIVVSGTILNYKDTGAVVTCDVYETLGTTRKPVLKVKPDGTYKLVIESDAPVKGSVSFGRVPCTYNFTVTLVNGKDSSMSVESADFRMVYLWLEPGDSLTMNLDVENIDQTLKFSGRGAVNNEFVAAE